MLKKMPVILDSFFRKIGDFRAWFRVEIRSFFGQMELFLLFFRARLSDKIDDLFTLLNAISKVNPANLLCRTVVG